MITLKEVVAAKPKTIYKSVNTVWWTDDPNDLCPGPVPLDVFGSPLWEYHGRDVEGWLHGHGIENCPAYGERKDDRIRNFMLAHAKNIHLPCNLMPSRSFSLVSEFKAFAKFIDENAERMQEAFDKEELKEYVRTFPRVGTVSGEIKYYKGRNGPYGKRYF